MIACLYGQIDIARMLVNEFRADVDKQNKVTLRIIYGLMDG